MNRYTNNNPVNEQPKLFTELTKDTKDKIAAIIENKCKENWLMPTVEGYVYGTARALDFGDYWGTLDKKALWEHATNKNSDLFEYTKLIEEKDPNLPYYLTYRDASFFVNHNSHDPALAIGLIFDATLVMSNYEDNHVVILFGVDRMKAPTIARTLETYPTRLLTSMGCSIKSSMCTVCEKKIFKDTDVCDCLRHHRGQRFRGRKVAELLEHTNFYEQSFVQIPAAPLSRILDAISEILPGRVLKVAAEGMGQEMDPVLRVMASIYQSIKIASTSQEKKVLSNRLDALINKLENMLQVG